MSAATKTWVVLATGGTIAGWSDRPGDGVGYAAGRVGVDRLLRGVAGWSTALAGDGCEAEQVAQCDSKDMTPQIWVRLAQRVAHHLARPEVGGVLVTHGTDTLEETAWAMQLLLPGPLLALKPVVFTCAMRPANAAFADGPQNLLDALGVARTPGARGVVAVCAGSIHSARAVQKVHTYRLDAFSSGEWPLVGVVEEGRVRLLSDWPQARTEQTADAVDFVSEATVWPRVEVVMNATAADGWAVRALAADLPGMPRLRGLVVAGTGNGTVSEPLTQALEWAQRQGVVVWRTTRCFAGQVIGVAGARLPQVSDLPPAKARVALMVDLLWRDVQTQNALKPAVAGG